MVVLETEGCQLNSRHWSLIEVCVYLSVFVFGVDRDEVVPDSDGQLVRGEVLYVQVNDKTILFNAHLENGKAKLAYLNSTSHTRVNTGICVCVYVSSEYVKYYRWCSTL